MEFNCRVVRKEILTEFLVRIWLRPDRAMTGFKAGQFCVIALPDDTGRPIKRAYSLASGENEQDLEMYIRLVPEGALTPKLWKLEPGGRLWIDDSRFSGHFTLEPAAAAGAKDLVMIGSGTGLAPFISMTRSELGKGRFERIVLLHGSRLPSEMSYTEECLGHCGRTDRPRVFYIPSVTRPAPEDRWDGLVGRIPGLIEKGILEETLGGALDPKTTHFFLCGNPDMCKDVEALLVTRGHKAHKKRDPGNVHTEKYW